MIDKLVVSKRIKKHVLVPRNLVTENKVASVIMTRVCERVRSLQKAVRKYAIGGDILRISPGTMCEKKKRHLDWFMNSLITGAH